MIAPGILVTAAHLAHVNNDRQQPVHTKFEVIRAPDVGQQMENAAFIAEDQARDIALLQVHNARSNTCVTLAESIIPTGTSVGSIGFPLAAVTFSPQGRTFNLIERFQGASISSFHVSQAPSGTQIHYYETDSLMYEGSSGCPGFSANSTVYGMHVASVTQNKPGGAAAPSQTRIAISLWVPSAEVAAFATTQGITLPVRGWGIHRALCDGFERLKALTKG